MLTTIRVPHDHERIELSWGVSLPATALLRPIFGAAPSRLRWAFGKRADGLIRWSLLFLLTVAIPSLNAQTAPCGITSITDTTPLLYPPIARQAHITGQVILLATFNMDGTVASTRVIVGNKMLEGSATEYLEHWRANVYTGPRECPIVINFRSFETPPCENSAAPDRTIRNDAQHVEISVPQVWICDPAATITTHRKHFLFF